MSIGSDLCSISVIHKLFVVSKGELLINSVHKIEFEITVILFFKNVDHINLSTSSHFVYVLLSFSPHDICAIVVFFVP